jgi:hypothetical protein
MKKWTVNLKNPRTVKMEIIRTNRNGWNKLPVMFECNMEAVIK